ncbi:hypothetical protein LZ554_007700 [Drepanopeziza brunnea f. sp. 'monogermtubi']|nr:hypothetical protein LZ554_007700 [Drepanopeziza brunnea f. sp. 'monogermtubi']
MGLWKPRSLRFPWQKLPIRSVFANDIGETCNFSNNQLQLERITHHRITTKPALYAAEPLQRKLSTAPPGGRSRNYIWAAT